ncbi:hypothetical protein PRIPAC_95477 [Pristionchus pacificus]|uniref:Uncharacterized protein n=1 Tax=Pristionchus pacificus TaxID=54126 RepID=A0A2A6BBY5_PRIPA|nr:hypothetical protein PRIPAC_95477 [Pristionchus pacificus]|eukprot:PDM63376.1 hypothetical protein PRIPAC_53733 [Pristionchus pacificus]
MDRSRETTKKIVISPQRVGSLPRSNPDPIHDLQDIKISHLINLDKSVVKPLVNLRKRSTSFDVERRFAAVRFEFPCNADITYVYIASLDILTEDGEYEYLRYLDTDQMTFRERIERWKWAADNVQEEAERTEWIVNYEKELTEDSVMAEEMQRVMERERLPIDEIRIEKERMKEGVKDRVRAELKKKNEEDSLLEWMRVDSMSEEERKREAEMEIMKEKKRAREHLYAQRSLAKKMETPEKKKEREKSLILDVEENLKMIKALTPPKIMAPSRKARQFLRELDMLSPQKSPMPYSASNETMLTPHKSQIFTYCNGVYTRVTDAFEPETSNPESLALAFGKDASVKNEQPSAQDADPEELAMAFFHRSTPEQEENDPETLALALFKRDPTVKNTPKSTEKKSSSLGFFSIKKKPARIDFSSYQKSRRLITKVPSHRRQSTSSTPVLCGLLNTSNNINTKNFWNESFLSQTSAHRAAPIRIPSMAAPAPKKAKIISPPPDRVHSPLPSIPPIRLPSIEEIMANRSKIPDPRSTADECYKILMDDDLLIERSPMESLELAIPETPSPPVPVTPITPPDQTNPEGQQKKNNSSVERSPMELAIPDTPSPPIPVTPITPPEQSKTEAQPKNNSSVFHSPAEQLQPDQSITNNAVYVVNNQTGHMEIASSFHQA